MDVVLLSRLQFGAAAFFHFLFVPLTLGLSILIAVMETIYVRTGDRDYLRMARFWGRLFIINFAIGVVTGITLEFQFGTNWSRYSEYVGDVFGPLLAIEATVAFFLESTFLAVWIFGWKRVSPRFHAAVIWLVAIASTLSALWIIAANAWMQHPVGFEIRGGRAELVDLWAILFQRFNIYEFLHVVFGAYLLAAFFVAGISAYHLMKKNETAVFSKSFKLAVWFALFCSLFEVVQGDLNGAVVAEYQPAKLAAMESFWETTSRAPLNVIVIPDPENEKNRLELFPIPGMLSMLAFRRPDAEVRGLKDFAPEDRPPVWPVFISFRVMVGLGFLFPALAALGVFLAMDRGFFEKRKMLKRLLRLRDFLDGRPRLLWIFVAAIPLPYLALETGWMLAEVGRQPWIVYGLLRTEDAASPVSAAQVWASLLGFILVYSILGAVNFILLYKYARRGPQPEQEAGHA